MLSRFISLTLAAVIFGCPFYCGVPSTADGDEGSRSACSGCCHHGEPSQPADSDSRPSNDQHRSNGVCQCVCGGAVIEQADLQVTPTDLAGFELAPVTVSLVACASQARLGSLHALLQPDDGMNPGRATRCLFMTFLC